MTLGGAAGAATQEGQADNGSFPDWSGQWVRVGSLDYPPEGYEEAGPPPLTEEYLAIWEEIRAYHEAGLPVGDPTATCLPPGMPRLMKMVLPMEVIIKADITYIYGEWDSQLRRVHTDGRDFPEFILPSFNGYSIGEWRDTNGDGSFDTLSIETRGLKGPRSFDHHGVPLHENNETVVLEEIRLVDDGILENRITTTDDALVAPWTIHQQYGRNTDDIVWEGHLCVNEPRYLRLGPNWYLFDPETETLEPANDQQPRLVAQ